jgi:outer membrane immunogenic protein
VKARLYLLSTVSALALAGNAFAADMPVKAPPQVVVVAPSWGGFYLGGHAGFAWLRHSDTISGPFLATICTVATTQTCSLKDTGAVAGGQVGYNWQQNNLVFGVEADGSWTGLKKTASSAVAGVTGGINDKVEWLASVRGRLGWAVGDMLFYGTGGVAWGQFNVGWRSQGGNFPQFDKTATGWVAGGGIEKMFGRNWSARAEFLHYGFGSKSVTGPGTGVFSGITYTSSFRHDVSVVRLGINFRQ